jgi:hypothetical protein
LQELSEIGFGLESLDMDQQPVEEGHTVNETDSSAKDKKLHWRHVFDWGFWTSSPLATIAAFFIGGILLSAITNFPGGSPKQLWYFAAGLWLLLGVIIFWVFSGVIARMEGRELLTAREIEEREQMYKDGIQSQLDKLGLSVADTQRRMAEQQRRRRLTDAQKSAIKQAIAPYSGQKIKILYPMNDGEASQYAQDFAAVFRDAGWQCDDIRGWFFATEFDNVVVAASNKLPAPVKPPKAIFPLVKVLMELGLTKNRGIDPLRMVNQSNDVEEDELLLRVEEKLPPDEPRAGSQPNEGT